MPTTFTTQLDADQYFAGLARQELAFPQAIGELIDNAFSARRPASHAEGFEPVLVEVTIEDIGDASFVVQVADSGIGIPLEDITTRVFNPGGQGSTQGGLNEHGFGLKNALALLTGGNVTGFAVLTRSSADAEELGADGFYRIDGPLGTEMSVDVTTRDDWSEDLQHLGDVATGTKIRAVVQERYFRTTFRRGNPGLDMLATRLGEHLGVQHRYFLEGGNEIRMAYRGAGGTWTHESVQPIPIPYEGDTESKKRELSVGAERLEFVYTTGALDYSVKDDEAKTEKGWPYPLRIYYQGSNARCGVDIVVRDRVIKTGAFHEIWPDIPKTVDFNRFVGELRVGPAFRTTNNKTGIDPNSEAWEQVVQELGEEEFRPEKVTRSETESSVREKLRKILEGIYTGKNCNLDRSVWGGGCLIDIFIDTGDGIRIYELKVTPGRVKDLYQLLMAWDGLVKENIEPDIAILVCKEYGANLTEAVTAANQRKDANGNNYVVELKTVSELIPA